MSSKKGTWASDTFCTLPFRHVCLGPEGTARVCCVTNELVAEYGAPMSLNVNSLDEIWNSTYMRSIRRGMLNGERISACQVCYDSESATGQSYRTTTGLLGTDNQPAAAFDVQSYGSKSRFYVNTRPDFIKLEVSNLCNLKCRMCYGAASSQIERDPVHGKWSGGVDPLHAVWRGTLARIGPEPRIGIRTSGLFAEEMLGETVRRWTDGHAVFNAPLQPGTALEQLEISFHPSGIRGQHFQIVLNGELQTKGVLQKADPPITISLERFRNADELTIEILSSRVIEIAGGPERGLPLQDLILRRKPSVVNPIIPQLLSQPIGLEGPWYADDHKLFEDVLKSAETLQRLYITGGEPLINERVAEILDFLVECGAARHIDLELSTNCTRVDANVIDLLKRFRDLRLYLSLDGIDTCYEYIRYPARWSLIDANVRKFKKEHGLACFVSPVIQIYNIMRLPELYRYCDAMDMGVTLNILHTPERLAIYNMPPRLRESAAARLTEYCDSNCKPENKAPLLALAHYLAEARPVDPGIIREFMVFTNDLDVTRGQSFCRTHPDLVQLLAQDGFEWIDETLHSKNASRSRPARERVYAWL